MNKKIVLIPIIMIIATFVTIFSLDPSERNGNVVFHVTLADSGLYANGVYTDTFTINEGEYSFRFVPNGSSPEILSIILNGENFDFSEDFNLESTLHQTGTSEYLTWKYVGQEIILISEMQEVFIIINPNGNVIGSVSVDILEN
ncbi:hypothetical protein HX847_00655 [Marine Group I thaumarchaeote]|uniref:Uncharacterized protein n=1 Tax=Marine Group I thaumarchaeote TaxID=2511932 RepID=A0A7K4P493_9ARCH|nr:hypothetical protein [Candidatus Nitrosopumilus sp. MTA1]NWJ56523.1 hypothetical protein [Marine Group I thaumarchaeote]NWJ83208.1 hypothetical protein [Marine Group I thaumarchaeote]NWK01466.1 hypothetical protein [Marine Group I thaumarchaeote]NWK06932.1 hypothetical protein [Marine Group I thaumarchaeote]